MTDHARHDTVSADDFADLGPIARRVAELVLPILNDLGISLYDIDHNGGVLRITLDRPGGIDLEAIALATRLIGRELDHEDPIPGHYTLEVSSPGLERSLRRPVHYATSIGRDVAVRLRDVGSDDRRVRGVLVAADEHDITVRRDDLTEVRIPYADVDRARTVFEWGPQPKPGKPGAKKAATSPAKAKAKPVKVKAKPAAATSAADDSSTTTTNQEVAAS